MPAPLLIVLGGLPATGKSTVAAELVRERGAYAYLRVDTIEQALRNSGEIGPAGVQNSGYLVAYAIAADLLAAGNDVLVECVNPIEITRSAWRRVADAQYARLLEVELFCSDPETHRGRVQTRVVDVPGLELPDWEAVQSRDYVPWTTAQLRIDTVLVAPAEAAARIRDAAATLA